MEKKFYFENQEPDSDKPKKQMTKPQTWSQKDWEKHLKDLGIVPNSLPKRGGQYRNGRRMPFSRNSSKRY